MILGSYFDHQSSGLHMFHYRTDHDMQFPILTSTRIGLWCLLDGSVSYMIEGNAYQPQPGDVLLIRPQELHVPVVDYSVPYERYGVKFNPDIFSSVSGNRSLFRAVDNQVPGTGNLFRATQFDRDPRWYFEKMIRPCPDNRLNVLTYTLLLLEQINNIYDSHEHTSVVKTDLGHRILSYINNNLTVPLTVEHICKEFYISSAQLFRLFRQVTGTTVGHYIAAKRLANARLLLRQGMKPAQVCSICGYQNYTTFFRAYVNYYGCAPKADYLYESQ